MRYFLDTEFIERGLGRPIELVSLALVAEDGRELYLVSTEFQPGHASAWVRDHVLAKLPDRFPLPPPHGSPRRWAESFSWQDLATIAQRVRQFVGDDAAPEFWGYFADYDWVVFCQLFGDMSQLPADWPFYCRDLKQLIDERGLAIAQDDSDHTALADARWVRETWLAIDRNGTAATVSDGEPSTARGRQSEPYWVECYDTFAYEPYGRQGPFATFEEADGARAKRVAEIRCSQSGAGSLQDTVAVYQTADPQGDPRSGLPYRVSSEGR